MKLSFYYNMKPHLLNIVLILVVGFIAYSNTLHVPFHYDDERNIIENHRIKNISNIPLLFVDIAGPPIAARPLTSATFALNYYFGGLNTFGYHLFNILLHVLNAQLLYFLVIQTAGLLTQYGSTKIRLVALFSSLIFVAHPVQTESVTYIVTRSALLSTTFFLLGIILFKMSATSQKNKFFYVTALLITSLSGVASREDFIIFPLVLVLYDYFFISKYKFGNVCRNYRIYIPVLVPLTYLGYIVRSYDYGQHAGFSVTLVTPVEYFMTQFNVLFTYLRLLLWPLGQNLDYDYSIARTIFEFPTFFTMIGYMSIWFAGIYLYKKTPIIAFCVIWFMVTLAPSSSLLPIIDVIFEHRLYLPLAGFSVGITALIFYTADKFKTKLPQLEATSLIALVLMIVILSGITNIRNFVWQSGISLWSDVIRKSPDKARGYNNLGYEMAKYGNFDNAIVLISQALKINPSFAQAHYNMGYILSIRGKLEEAKERFLEAIRIYPTYKQAYNGMGVIASRQKDHSDALKYFSEALGIDPNYADAHNNLGMELAEMGKYQKAVEHYLKALKLKQNFVQALNNLGVALGAQGRYEEAIFCYTKALQINPSFEAASYNLKHASKKVGKVGKSSNNSSKQ